MKVKSEPGSEGLLDGLHTWVKAELRRAIEPEDQPRTHTLPSLPAHIGEMVRRLSLTVFEVQVILLCFAAEVDERLGDAFAHSPGNYSHRLPTFGLAFRMFDEPSWESVLPSGKLSQLRLIEVDSDEQQGLLARPLRLSDRVLAFMLGLQAFDQTLATIAHRVALGSMEGHSDYDAGDRLEAVLLSGAIVQLRARDESAAQRSALMAAESCGLMLYRMLIEDLPDTINELDVLVRLWMREAALSDCAVYLASLTDMRSAKTMNYIAERLSLPILVHSNEHLSILTRDIVTVEVSHPDRTAQKRLWLDALPSLGSDAAATLAQTFDLEAGDIRKLSRTASVSTPSPSFLDVWSACRAHGRANLDPLAARLVLNASWDDLVLPSLQEKQLRSIVNHCRHRWQVEGAWGFGARMGRGLGLNVLFAGESGTGKTLAAEVIAEELQLDLYRIDLASVVSKFIGETEKNLSRLFDAGERGGQILLFDEADALFGKRSEVKDSHDRYANIEVNYLLQRMESYRGLSILTTNRKSAIDAAFLRRMSFVVDFPFPDKEMSRRIWEGIFPPETPIGGVDFSRLSELGLSGGSIQTAALNAAFLAAERQTQVDMEIVLEAVRDELRKSGSTRLQNIDCF